MSNIVLLIDDHPLFRLGLTTTLQQLGAELKVVEAASLPEALECLTAGMRFDLILYDWHLRGRGGVQGLLAVCQLAQGVAVVVISADEDEAIRIAAQQIGAADFLSKAADPTTIRDVLGQHLRRSAPENHAPVDDAPRAGLGCVQLSPRQQEVLQRMAQGESNKRIAQRLTIAETTVRAHVSDILRLLNSANRTEAVVKARRLGLITFG